MDDEPEGAAASLHSTAPYIIPARTDERLVTSPMLAVALGVTVAGVLIIGTFPSLLLLLVQAAAPIFFG